MRALVAELKSKVDTLTFISERLRVENAGPIGPQGPMGRDGHDGGPRPRGERGGQGERGPAAVAITAWEPRPDRFELVPVYADGSRGVPASLRSLFEHYNSATEAEDEAD